MYACVCEMNVLRLAPPACSAAVLWQLVATVNFLRTDNMTYPGCPKDFNGRTCQKKLQDDGNGGW